MGGLPQELLDWGYADIRFKKTKRTLEKIKSLIDLYQPEAIVLEDPSSEETKKSPRIRKLISTITELAIAEEVPVTHYSPEDVSHAFPKADKHLQAHDIAKVLPELKPYLPPKRRIWDTQHERMQIFDAASLAITFFYLET